MLHTFLSRIFFLFMHSILPLFISSSIFSLLFASFHRQYIYCNAVVCQAQPTPKHFVEIQFSVSFNHTNNVFESIIKTWKHEHERNNTVLHIIYKMNCTFMPKCWRSKLCTLWHSLHVMHYFALNIRKNLKWTCICVCMATQLFRTYFSYTLTTIALQAHVYCWLYKIKWNEANIKTPFKRKTIENILKENTSLWLIEILTWN